MVRRLLTICQQLTVHGPQPIAIKDKVGADDKIHLNANQRKQGLKFKKMSCGLWSVSRRRLAAMTMNIQCESLMELRLI